MEGAYGAYQISLYSAHYVYTFTIINLLHNYVYRAIWVSNCFQRRNVNYINPAAISISVAMCSISL